ncbi:MAG TPA: HDOD domain-containing protein [Steroidobacteraceae bacterium]|nr:HDOD domain-containing protein [Steroidobacteraceae bacterium]
MSGDTSSVSNESGDVAFTFVQALAAELSGGKVELPGFPHIVMQVQRVLSDENADASRIVRVIGSEPVLAAQLVRMANSAALRTSGTPVMDLRAAVARVGLDTVRSATIAFAIQQLREAPALRGLEKQLGVLWRHSVQVAALSYAVARRLTTVGPDTAMLAGLLQGIGKLYILTRASRHRSLFADPLAYQTIEHDWHLSIAAALLENWGIADEIVQAVHDSENFDRDCRGTPCLADVLVVATMLADLQGEPAVLRAQTQCAKPLQRLRLDYAACEAFLKESAQEIAALRDALG